MRRPNRHIEIFSMSALDLFASALGAFILITTILWPAYRKATQDDLKRERERMEIAKAELAKTRQETNEVAKQVKRQQSDLNILRRTESEFKACRENNHQCLVQLARNFLMVRIEWTQAVDVNLSVTDPNYRVFSWDKSNRKQIYPETKARLSIDATRGPGIEVWLDPEARPGKYVVKYTVPRKTGMEIAVRGTLVDRTGARPLATVSISPIELGAKPFTIEIKPDGSTEVH